jgi:hypothetical protein
VRRLALLFLCAAGCGRDGTECPPCPPAAAAAEPPPAARADVTAMAGRALALMKAGDSAGLHALFDADMKAAVPADTLAPMLADLVAQRGAFVALEPVDVAGDRGRFRLRAERGSWNLEVRSSGAATPASSTSTSTTRASGGPPTWWWSTTLA